MLGAWRAKTTDEVDYGVGFEMHARIGDQVKAGAPLLTIYHRAGRGLEECKQRLNAAFSITEKAVTAPDLILERV